MPGKCVARHPVVGVKCNRWLAVCLRTGNHCGRSYFRKTKATPARFETHTWHQSLEPPLTDTQEWQRAIKGEIKNLGYVIRDCKNPVTYRELTIQRRMLAARVVRSRTRGRVTSWVRRDSNGVVTPAFQKPLEGFEDGC